MREKQNESLVIRPEVIKIINIAVVCFTVSRHWKKIYYNFTNDGNYILEKIEKLSSIWIIDEISETTTIRYYKYVK